jgi:FKBP-type peptidyl-prolyl cis-trans isomerase
MSKKWINRIAILIIGLLAVAACCTTAGTPAKTSDANSVKTAVTSTEPNFVFKTPMDKISYSYGVEIARGLKRQGVELSLDAMTKGMKDAIAGGKLLMSDEDIRMNVATLQSDIRSKQARSKLMAAQDNKQEGEAFLAANKTKEGVVTLPSGLQYKIIRAGNGPKPTDSSTVACHYRGTLIDGTEFDSSAHSNNEGEPAMFKVSDVIAGWREALKLMPAGSKWQLFVPPSLAYGQRGTGRFIGPNTTLIFEVELVATK